MSQVLSAWTEDQCQDELGRRIKGNPEPEIVRGLTGVGEEFVELEVSESQAVTEVLV
jgi:hypothetical protein